MYTAEEQAILAEMAVETAVSVAKAHDEDVAVGVSRNDYIDRLTFFFGKFVSREQLNTILRPLLELGAWVPEDVRWKLFDADIHVRGLTLVRLNPLLRGIHA